MKVIIGDMSFEADEAECRSHFLTPWRDKRDEHLKDFIKTAEKLYIERHGSKPERSTVEEF